MDALHFLPDQATWLETVPESMPAVGWLWLDVMHEEVASTPEVLRETVARLTGVRLYDLHLTDAANLLHPSYYDGTRDYDMLVFRKLSTGETQRLEALAAQPIRADERRTLQELITRPVTFFVIDRLLVTVRDLGSQTVKQMRERVLEYRRRGVENGVALPDKLRLPNKPEELMLRLLNGMVDRYLDLRQPLATLLDRWQRELLDPARPFSNWRTLLHARNELRKLEDLCEEQVDALGELRDSYLENHRDAHAHDAFLVRLADVTEHIGRVLQHARRLESSLETAVQIHFNAQSNRTNQIVTTLTVITSIFAPLNLLAGIYGMNFHVLPGADHPWGFWIMLGAMGFVATTLLVYFSVRRILRLRKRR
ncbi:MAG TPA: magnesium transporter CorA family protein [Burkholderiaceae bacterium]|nr:magnesium transporter CorA family protein [Burkholderiaceae bacterium]